MKNLTDERNETDHYIVTARELETKSKTVLYTIWIDQIGDGIEDDFTPQFTFEAKNQKDADGKARSWAQYHGFSADEVVAKPTEGKQLQWPTHNEWTDGS